MSLRLCQVKKTSLRVPLDAADTTVKVRKLVDVDDNEVAFSDFGEFVVIVLKQGDVTEIIKCSGITQNADDTADLTVATNGRSIAPTYPHAGAATGEDFQTAEVIVTNDVLTMSRFANLDNENTWDEIQTFTVPPKSSAAATAATDLVRKTELDAAALGSLTVTPLVLPGTAGETLAIDQVVYLKVSDGRWWLCDADTAATVDNVVIGITRGAGATGAAITNGVTIIGEHVAASAIFTANTAYFVSNTAGGFATSAGTTEISLGVSRSTTAIMLYPRYNQVLTEDQQDAFVGTSGTPSATNKFVTANDDARNYGSQAYAATTTSNDTYVVTLSPVPAGLVDGMTLQIKLDVANTGPATLNVNSLGALALVKGVSTALVTGDLLANQVITVVYNSTGTVWQIVQAPALLMDGSVITDQHFHKKTYGVAAVANGSSQVIAHGLGVTPKRIRIKTVQAIVTGVLQFSEGLFNGTTYACVFSESNGGSIADGTSTAYIITVLVDATGSQVTATVTLNATNITLTWSATTTTSASMLWEAEV